MEYVLWKNQLWTSWRRYSWTEYTWNTWKKPIVSNTHITKAINKKRCTLDLQWQRITVFRFETSSLSLTPVLSTVSWYHRGQVEMASSVGSRCFILAFIPQICPSFWIFRNLALKGDLFFCVQHTGRCRVLCQKGFRTTPWKQESN